MLGQMIRWVLYGAALVAALAGIVLAGEGLWMAAKAEVGQQLLHRAFDRGETEPWPDADMRPLARLSVPALGESAVILDTASGKAMAWGPGHVPGTALPGDPGLSAIGGHRDSHLAFLGDLAPGAELLLERTEGETRRFTVTHAEIVDSRVWRYPVESEGAPRLALTTCWPLDAETPGPMRLVVYATSVSSGAITEMSRR